MVRKKVIKTLFDYLTVFLGILASFITALVAFVSDSLIVVLSVKVKSNTELAFIVPIIILTIYLLSLFVLSIVLSIVFRKNNYMPISILLHLILSPILALMMHTYFIGKIIDLFAIRELISPAEGMILFFVAIIFCIELLVLSIISVLTFIITKVVRYKKSKDVI